MTGSLAQCTVSDLLSNSKGFPADGKILRVRSINQCFLQSGLHICVEDAVGNIILLLLYNFIDIDSKFDELQFLFPIGIVFEIKNPYLKVSNSGSICLRADNPSNVTIKMHVHNTQSIPTVLVELDPTALKTQGNAEFTKKNYLSALEHYSDALDELSFQIEPRHICNCKNII